MSSVDYVLLGYRATVQCVEQQQSSLPSAKATRRLIQAPKSGTVLDSLSQELNGTYINQP